MNADTKATILELIQQVEDQSGDWRVALEDAKELVESLPTIDTKVIYAVSWEVPDSMGGVDWNFDQGVMNRIYVDTLENLKDNPGALVRMFKIDAHDLITFTVDSEIWGMTSELSPEDLPDGYEYLAGQRVGPVA